MKLILFLIFVFIGEVCYSQFTYKLSVLVPEEWNNAKVYMIIPKDNQAEFLIKDSTNIKSSSSHFEGKFDRPCYRANLRIVLKSKSYFYNFVLDSGLNRLNLAIRPKSLKLRNSFPIISESNIINTKLDSIFYETTNRYPNGQLTAEFHNDCQVQSIKFLKKYPDNYFSLSSLYLISLHHSSPIRDSLILETLDTFNKDLQLSPLGLKLRKEKYSSIEAAYSSKIGHKVNQFNVRKADGSKFSNSMLSGKPYVIAFSATWCHPCQQQLPQLLDLYKKFADKGLEVMYFNLDDNVSTWTKHIKKHNLTWINVSERTKFRDSEIAKTFHVYGIPSYFVIDKEGMIIYNSDQMDPEFNTLEEHIKKATL